MSLKQPQFVENPEPRCLAMLLLDTSYSMRLDGAIQELNKGIAILKQELERDEVASLRVEVAIVTFGGDKPQLVSDFATVDEFKPPQLTANGSTPMGQAIELALDKVEERKQIIRNANLGLYRPWVFLITDGEPTDNWENAAQRVRSGDANKKFAFFAVGVRNANMEILGEIAPLNTPPLLLDGLKFKELFLWLSGSLQAVSVSQPGEQIETPSISGWTTMETAQYL